MNEPQPRHNLAALLLLSQEIRGFLPHIAGVGSRMGMSQTREADHNRRVFDRIAVSGLVTIDGETFRIRDVSVGGLSAFGRPPDLSVGDIKPVTFQIKHGDLEVSGTANAECLSNGHSGPLRFKLLNPSESMSEFFRAVTLRSVSGADYTTGWISENAQHLALHNKPTRARRGLGVLPSVLVTAVGLAAMLYVGQSSSGHAVWVTHSHELEAPISGRLSRDAYDTHDITPDQTIATFSAKTVGGTQIEIPMKSGVSAESIDWLFNSGDVLEQGEIVARATVFPLMDSARQAAVSISLPILRPRIGDTIILKENTGRTIEATIKRISLHADEWAVDVGRFKQSRDGAVLIVQVMARPHADAATLHVDLLKTAVRMIYRRLARN